LVGKQEEERHRHKGKYIKMDRVHSGFIWSRAESSDRTNVLPSLNLTINLLTTTIVAPPSNASKWQMGFNLAFKGLTGRGTCLNDFTVVDIR